MKTAAITDLKNPSLPIDKQRQQLDTLRRLNELHQQKRQEDSQLSARIASFELAFRMQTKAPEALNIESESAATKRLYGLHDKTTEIFGTQCLMARRFAERSPG